jgi:hypothetical protein
LLLAAFVAVDLAQVDAGGAREPGLGEPGVLAQPSQDLAEVDTGRAPRRADPAAILAGVDAR